ncbi:helix-turn-helix domain-containing protein [Micromonospora sp. DT4]|uniref:helix-turn-helix domain-containing protein n=1 Tax=Micromonospora sp. DT4 TaxID=3393438 RepID=UPI003CF2FBE6
MLVQIESARTNPSVGTLCRVADAFGVNIARLVEPDEEQTVRISSTAEAPVLWQGEHGGSAHLLSGLANPTSSSCGTGGWNPERDTAPPTTPAAPARSCTSSAGR